jgi:hypothetical protein
MIRKILTSEGRAKYTGLHALRHFYAFWCINRREDGGLGVTPKLVQERLGHSTNGMTLDVYRHLFPRGDDGSELAAAEKPLLGVDCETEQLPLFSPAGRQPRRQAHQCLGGEVRRFSAIDDGRGDVGRQPGKTQEGIEVGCRHV